MRAAKAAGSSRKTPRAKLFRIKVISLGDQAVGKSCLIKRWAQDLKYDTDFSWAVMVSAQCAN
eukprot:1159506-Pelagomonas_calceolata.AAC.17